MEALNRELCARIRSGDFDEEPTAARLLVALRQQVEDALALWNPEFLARIQADG